MASIDERSMIHYSDHWCSQCFNAMFGKAEQCEEGKNTTIKLTPDLAKLDDRILRSTFGSKSKSRKKKIG